MIFDRDTSLTDPNTPLGVQSKISTSDPIAKGFIINFGVNRIQRKPIFFITEQISNWPQKSTRLPVDYVVLSGRNSSKIGVAYKRFLIDVTA